MATVIRGGDNFDTADNATQTELDAKVVGKVLQVVSTQLNTSMVSTTSTSLIAVGKELSITPTSASSKILVMMDVGMGIGYHGAARQLVVARNGASLNTNAYGHHLELAGLTGGAVYASEMMVLLDSPNTTASTTYALYGKSGSGSNVYLTHSGSTVNITLMEVSA